MEKATLRKEREKVLAVARDLADRLRLAQAELAVLRSERDALLREREQLRQGYGVNPPKGDA